MCIWCNVVQQSHHCGIETIKDEGDRKWSPRSNRTIVGLKLGLVKDFLDFIKQQSHHCGIETRFGGLAGWKEATCSNRTIVGLKRICASSNGNHEGSQQSHHCGIETEELEDEPDKTNLQQSHHCGIETEEILSVLGVPPAAAIAPLWD